MLGDQGHPTTARWMRAKVTISRRGCTDACVAHDITRWIQLNGNVTIGGELMTEGWTSARANDDVSEPGNGALAMPRLRQAAESSRAPLFHTMA